MALLIDLRGEFIKSVVEKRGLQRQGPDFVYVGEKQRGERTSKS